MVSVNRFGLQQRPSSQRVTHYYSRSPVIGQLPLLVFSPFENERKKREMNLLPRHGADFQKADYWREFFDKRQDPFEWYGTYWDLAHLFTKYVKQQDQILMVGCGNSELSEELYDKQK